MKRRRMIILALAIVLAFAGSTAPRHVRAAVQEYHPSATQQHSHNHDMMAASDAATSGTQDQAGDAPPVSDRACCYAWCYSGALACAPDWPSTSHVRSGHSTFERPFRIAAYSAAIDPPPR